VYGVPGEPIAPKSLNVATPKDAVAVVVPIRVAPSEIVAVTVAEEFTAFEYAS
jgi:hypothetical protein